jgi:nucleoid-associated protein YgaU
MPSRYSGRRIVRNTSDIYKEFREERDVLIINQYKTPRLKHLTSAQRVGLVREKHVWKTGDRYWKLATEHYGDPKLWWVIAWYNQKPTEGHLTIGDTILIPKPLQRVLEMMRYY